jgi:hypothetical protein
MSYDPAARVHERAARPAIHLHALPPVREDRRMQRKIIRAGRVDDDVRHTRVPFDELQAVRVGERALDHAHVQTQRCHALDRPWLARERETDSVGCAEDGACDEFSSCR